MTPRLVIVVPVLDERDAVAPLLTKFAALSRDSTDYRIVFVDGGSTDGTVEIIRSATTAVECLQLPPGLGLGEALERGLEHVLGEHEIVVTMDGDDSHDPAIIPTLVDAIDQGADVVIASRFAPGGAEVGVSWYRRLMSHAASALLRTMLPFPPVRDYSSGFRAYRDEKLRALRARRGRMITERGFACMLELLLGMRALGVRVSEVPLVLRYDRKPGASKMHVPSTVVRYLALIRRYAGRRHPDRVVA